MGDPKPFASLSSGLLARKGGASPAMRRPVFGSINGHSSFSGQDDLGWNDMGEERPVVADVSSVVGLTPMTSPQAAPVEIVPVPAVVEQREALEARVSGNIQEDVVEEPKAEATPKLAVSPERKTRKRTSRKADAEPRTAKAAFTLRLDPERHLKLRLSCAIENRSAQQIVTQALDHFLNQHPELEALANRIPHGTRTHSH